MSFFKRIGKEKHNYLVSVTLVKISAPVDCDCSVWVQWARGPQKDKSNEYDLNELATEVVDFENGPEVFQRVTTMYTNDGGKTFDKKTCDFELFMKKDGKNKLIGENRGYNLSAHVGESGDEEVQIPLQSPPKSQVKDCYLVVKWDIQQSTQDKKEFDKSRESMIDSLGSTSVMGRGAEIHQLVNQPERLKELLEKHSDLNKSNSALEKDIEIYTNVKDNL